jgi:hypothetical protein
MTSSMARASATLLLLMCGACGGDGKVTVDAARDARAITVDAPPPCQISAADFGVKGTLTGESIYDPGSGTPAAPIVSVVGELKSAAPKDLIIVELLSGFAPFGTQTSPLPPSAGTYTLAGSQLNYSTCGVCVRGIAARTGGLSGMGGGDDFMATGGTVKITEVGTRVGDKITLELTNISLEQVKIGANYVSTPVNNNCTTKITSATFTGTMIAPPAKPGDASVSAGNRLRYQLSRVR